MKIIACINKQVSGSTPGYFLLMLETSKTTGISQEKSLLNYCENLSDDITKYELIGWDTDENLSAKATNID